MCPRVCSMTVASAWAEARCPPPVSEMSISTFFFDCGFRWWAILCVRVVGFCWFCRVCFRFLLALLNLFTVAAAARVSMVHLFVLVLACMLLWGCGWGGVAKATAAPSKKGSICPNAPKIESCSLGKTGEGAARVDSSAMECTARENGGAGVRGPPRR